MFPFSFLSFFSLPCVFISFLSFFMLFPYFPPPHILLPSFFFLLLSFLIFLTIFFPLNSVFLPSLLFLLFFGFSIIPSYICCWLWTVNPSVDLWPRCFVRISLLCPTNLPTSTTQSWTFGFQRTFGRHMSRRSDSLIQQKAFWDGVT